ncbi:MAG: sigma-54 dependent transcriptional regulator [Myxococcota bacterium]|nr:sigma-54 dependent transcriptional regulator [Myxococcota bacterium]
MTLQKEAILVVEDDGPQRMTLVGFLKKRGYRVFEAQSAAQATAVCEAHPIDLMLTDLRLGGPDGIALTADVRERQPELQTIVITAYGTVNDAVRAMRSGAYDFLTKPIDLDHLDALVEKALEKAALSRENSSLREVVKATGAFSGLIGQSPAIQTIIDLAARIAPSKASVFIQGESGTGKEVLARAIHLASTRKQHPFITVNCAALPETLIESELFGHEQGAFTGAIAQKKGRFELASEGTIFLDEVGEIPLTIQVKLLNVLQSGQFERIGGTKTLETDTRIIAATNRDIQEQLAEGAFREDLYYRLNVVPFTLPPLRERAEDIPLLARRFLEEQADINGSDVRDIDPEVMALLQAYPFPGNIRELKNWIERAVVLALGKQLTREDFPDLLFHPAAPQHLQSLMERCGLDEEVAALEISLIKKALAKNNGNQSAAARDLKITERGIRYKIKKYNL